MLFFLSQVNTVQQFPGSHHLTFIRSLSSKCTQPLREDLPIDAYDLYLLCHLVGGINDLIQGIICHTSQSSDGIGFLMIAGVIKSLH